MRVYAQMSKFNSNHGFVSLLYSVADDPLRLWSKSASTEQSRVRRIEDENLRGDRVIEIRGSDNSPIVANISCPASPIDRLNIKLPILVVIVKNLKTKFRMDLQLIDEEGIRRKFFIATYETSSKGRSSATSDYDTVRVPLKLEDDWNQLEIDLRTWCRSAFRTEYRALQRLIVYQNCRLRRVYLQDRHYGDAEASIRMCQAFFDMYMLKWGINYVERACQTDTTSRPDPTNEKSESFMVEKMSISSVPLSAKQSQFETASSVKKESPSKDKSAILLKSNLLSVSELVRATEKTSRGIIGNKQKVSSVEKKKAASRDNLSSAAVPTKEDKREGQIFRKWPYNYAQAQGTQPGATASARSSNRARSPILVPAKSSALPERRYFKGNVPKLSINEVTVSAEVLRLAADENRLERTRSKLLTTDEAVDRYLELRHVVDRMILENFRSRGLTTISEVELSIYNSKNRRNSYGQDKLVERRRTSVEKACEFDNERKEREICT